MAWCAASLAVYPQVALAEPATATESPKPTLLKSESEHLAKLDAALAPVLNLQPSADDAKRIREAAEAVKSNNMDRFNELKAAITDPVAKKLVEFIRLRAGYGEAAEYSQWLKANPLWPERTMMVQRMEEALFTQGGSAPAIKEFFKSAPPETGLGYAALASAYLAEDNKAEATKHAVKAWRDMTLPGLLETGFLRRFGSLLTEADHKWRFDRMTTDDVRWAGNRTERATFARRVIPLLSESEQKVAIARLAVFNKSANANALMAALPDGDSKNWGLQFHRAQLLRKAGKVSDAAKIILAAPKDPAQIAVLDEWWAERRELAYGALKAGDAKLAYELTKDAGPLTVNPLKEQTFMAGWIAFRHLKKTDAAEKHFNDLAKAADGPLSRAKAAYWLARVAESRGDKSGALEAYQRAAKNPDTFHGLLAMQKVEPGRTKLAVTPPAMPTAEQLANFISLDAVKAVVLARKAGLGREHTRGFLTSLRIGLPSEAEAGMVAHLGQAIGDTQMSLRIAKAAIAKGQNLVTYGYPVHPFPAYTPLRKPPETAMLLGIARQETEFEPQTVSGAGAKGLLQVMTVTANEICQNYKFKCDIPRLLTDNAYNVKIASAYIANYMDEFSGSYVLGLAGYNAGPGRARQWIRENGDPRDPKVDIVDWIERIPITETREYVTKVLSNIQIYRARLGESETALRLEQDLARARGERKLPSADRDREPSDSTTDKSEG
jgi:soluble lytic murein transglycosylase